MDKNGEEEFVCLTSDDLATVEELQEKCKKLKAELTDADVRNSKLMEKLCDSEGRNVSYSELLIKTKKEKNELDKKLHNTLLESGEKYQLLLESSNLIKKQMEVLRKKKASVDQELAIQQAALLEKEQLVKTLSNQIDTHKRKEDSFSKLKESYTNDIKILFEQKEEALADIAALEQRLKSSKEENDLLMNRFAELQKEYAVLDNELEQLKKNYHDLRLAYDGLGNENERKMQVIVHLRQEIEHYETQIDQLQDDIFKEKEDAKNTKLEICGLHADELMKIELSRQQELNAFIDDKNRAREVIETLKSELSTSRDEKQLLQSELDLLQEMLDDTRNAILDEKKVMKKEMTLAKDKYEELYKLYHSMVVTQIGSKGEFDELREKLVEMKDQSEVVSKELDEVKHLLGGKTLEITALSDEVDDLCDEVTKLEKQVDEKKKKIRELEVNNAIKASDIDELETRLSAHEKQCSVCHESISALNSCSATHTFVQVEDTKKVEKLNMQIESLEEEIECKEDAFERYDNECAKVHHDLETKNAKLHDMILEKDLVIKELQSKLDHQTETVNKQSDKIRENDAKMMSIIDDLRKEKDSLKRTIEKMVVEYDALEDKVENIKSEKDIVYSDANKLFDEVETLQEEQKALKKKAKEMCQNLHETVTHNMNLSKDLRQSKKDYDELKDTYEKFKEMFDNMEKEKLETVSRMDDAVWTSKNLQENLDKATKKLDAQSKKFEETMQETKAHFIKSVLKLIEETPISTEDIRSTLNQVDETYGQMLDSSVNCFKTTLGVSVTKL